MTTLEALIRLRDDLKEWVTNNLNAIGKPKASDVSIEPINGLSAADVQSAFSELNSKITNEINTVSIDSCSTVQEIANTMLANAGKVGETRCGQLDNYASSSALGKPDSSWNYARAYADVTGPYLIRLTAMQLLGSGIKTGHIFYNDSTWVWTGWK